MTEKKKTDHVAAKKEKEIASIFDGTNHKLMIGGGILIIAGILLMIGGKSADPNVFDPKEVYSFQRITLAPILIIAGLIVEIVAIMWKSKKQ
jgi:hypothetical protein